MTRLPIHPACLASDARHLRQQRGIATLAVTLLIFCAMMLAALFVNRSLLVEQRSATNQYRASQAFEAADAGLEWAAAQLNNPKAIGTDCLASSAETAATFRERYLRVDAHGGAVSLAPAGSSTSLPRQPACVHAGANAWSCTCPSTSSGSLPTSSGSAIAPAFSIQMSAGDRPGVVRVRSSGCTRFDNGCVTAGGAGGSTEANAIAAVSFILVPAVRTPPTVALTTITAADGRSISVGTSSTQLFAAHFGIGKAHWKQQPAVTRLDCESDCSTALRSLLSASAPSLIWVEGDVSIDGPLAIGSAERPIVIVATGAVQLNGGVHMHGLLYAASVTWSGAGAAGAQLRGAVISESTFVADAASVVIHDPDVLATLQRARGSFVRIPGSWRDF